MNLRHFFLALVVAMGLSSEPAFAVRQYRCNGRVQYRPCEDGTPTGTFKQPRRSGTADATSQHPFLPIDGARFAKITSQEFSPVSKSQGLWRGKVKGNGLVELSLQIFRGDRLDSTRYMGSVWLRNKETKFKFQAPLPAGKDWHWNVIAWAS